MLYEFHVKLQVDTVLKKDDLVPINFQTYYQIIIITSEKPDIASAPYSEKINGFLKIFLQDITPSTIVSFNCSIKPNFSYQPT